MDTSEKSTVLPEIAGWLDEIVAIRRDLHAHPEAPLEETRTAATVARLLRDWGADTVAEGVGRTGVVATVRGRLPGSATVALRADMDCLSLAEKSGVPWASCRGGKMHACGHDGHTAGLLAAGRYLAQTRDFPGTALLLFQPAEENGAGAQAVIADGLFRRWRIDEIYGLHNTPALPLGKASLREGPFYAAADFFSVTVRGVGGHGSRPWMTTDPLIAAQAIAGALQTIVSRNVSPFDTAVVTVGSLQAGDTRAGNVIGDTATLGGTVRTYSPAVQARVESRVRDIVAGLAQAYGVTAFLEYECRFPCLTNPAEQTRAAREIAVELLGAENVTTEDPITASEDFSRYLEHVPGSFIRTGNRDDAHAAPLHNPRYDFNDKALGTNASLLARLAVRRLQALAQGGK